MNKRLSRIYFKCCRTKDGCFEWNGTTYPSGYPQISYLNKKTRGNRLVWFLENGEIPRGMCILHMCDNRRCLEISHLRLGTHAENMADMSSKKRSFNQKKSHCKNGHEFGGDNVRLDKRGRRVCKACFRELWRKNNNYYNGAPNEIPKETNRHRSDST